MSPTRYAGVCAHVRVVSGAPAPPQLRSPSGMANSPSVPIVPSPWDCQKKRCSRRLPAPFRSTLASSDADWQTGVMARGVVPNGRGSVRVHTPKRGPLHLHTREQNLFFGRSRRLPAPIRPTEPSLDPKLMGLPAFHCAKSFAKRSRQSPRAHPGFLGVHHLYKNVFPFFAVRGGCRLHAGQLALHWIQIFPSVA